ncbi:uroporphyrinogen-III synthase [Arachidicoccus ginsenosidimutans]|uniref:uroporphyrinogen-III synthase n=1 Tax=Arachidicoccus sp. BS20 TaxID=1850526 RepID=UPI0007F107C1|nr:uroporphyrinogen-III synthase [Arachidicoccus sp. BS20]ANI89199.1 uroporphyrinogen-III synthase [Arachidicoccus sp. BS20]
MVKSVGNSLVPAKTELTILITQPAPSSEKSPYYDVARKHNAMLVFHPFIKLEGLSAKEFRKQKIDILSFTAVIFTSRNAIDHFFRMCEEMKISVGQDTKYFCITEAVALYLQKFILYRKRKVFFGADGTNKSLFDVMNKHKENEKFLYVCSENQQDSDIVSWLKNNKCEFELAFMYRTVSNDVKSVMEKYPIDIICFFTPSGLKSLLDVYPDFPKSKIVCGAFGSGTEKACIDAGVKLQIVGPTKDIPNMAVALDLFLGKKPSAEKKKAAKA